MRPTLSRSVLSVLLLCIACGSSDSNNEGVSAEATANLTVGGYPCPQTGTIAVSTIPADNEYYLTTFSGGTMACGAQADGVSLYVADKQRFGCGTHLRVTNPANGKSCVATVGDLGPNICVEEAADMPIIDASPAIAEQLFGEGSEGWSSKALVTATVTTDPIGCGTAAAGCTTDADCNGGQTGTQKVCGNDGTCITGCHSNSDCPSNDICNTTESTWSCTAAPPAPVVDAGPSCSGGLTLCASTCVDLTSDLNNCGGCGQACSSGQSCQSSQCTDPTGTGGGNGGGGGGGSGGGSAGGSGGGTGGGSGQSCAVCTCDDNTCATNANGDCDDQTNCLGNTNTCTVCTCDDNTCATDANGDCDDQTNCLGNTNTCTVCTCDDNTCPTDASGSCSDGTNCLNGATCPVCTCDDNSCGDQNGDCSDGYNCLNNSYCGVCTCDDNSCPSDASGTCSDGFNCLSGDYCGVCTCDDNSCPTDSGGDCSDGYNCVSDDYCDVCTCDDNTCAIDADGDCDDQTNCSGNFFKHPRRHQQKRAAQ